MRYNNSSIKIDEHYLPEKPTWSVRSLLPPIITCSDTTSKPIISQEEYKSLLKLSNLRSTSPTEDSQLIQDINLLCYFVKLIQDVDVTNVKPMRSILEDGINLNLYDEEEEEEENEEDKNENQGRELLKRANVLYKEFYVVKTGNNNNY
ncbi:unnamed protein product [Rhizophagus irregularis]|uniref:Glutamyl-tRNA amidotransferase complex subunit Gta3 domain-containing protein n=1 Tax=Rhizophagus irregularis TaxID=588596 RepID=A0A2I1G4S2_9GLOM|nr:hypothetical protein RhiirA4_501143 [Rhizophagus irregularis]CAB4423470.1 unnamed protein product [Rhizophagus irregularis]CAB4423814.1 unnamed protein product [Rhizophagus irregularis]